MLTTTSKKMPVIGLIMITGIIAAAWMMIRNTAQDSQIPSKIDGELQANFPSPAPSSSSTNSAEQKPSPIKSKVIEQFTTMKGTPTEAAEVRRWFATQGDYSFSDNNTTYASYDEETLEKLAQNGDLRAITALAELYLDIDHFHKYGFEGIKKQFMNAAIHGSTEAFETLALIHSNTVYYVAKNDAEKKAAALEVLALYNTAALRGNKLMNINSAKSFREMQHITLSDEDQKFIEQRSQQIYDDLQQKRRDLGLGDFDNSAPPEVERFFNRLEGKDD